MIVGRVGSRQPTMPRAVGRRPHLWRLVAAGGTVLAAEAAHVGAGGTRPAASLLIGLVVLLAAGSALVPVRLRTRRVALALAVLLQPVLHVLFDRMPAVGATSSSAPTMSGPWMLTAHLGAAGLGAWWLARGASRLVAAAERLAGRLVPVRPGASAAGIEADVDACSAAPFVRSRVLLAAVSRRGPPARPRLLPVV